MAFSSIPFLCAFFPVVTILYYLMPFAKLKNWFLIAASLLFYAYGEGFYVLLMLGCVCFNYLLARLIGCGKRGKKVLLILGILLNLGVLGMYKYAGMILTTVNRIAGTDILVPAIHLPIGISFFIFQALSYVIDVYRGKVKADKSLTRVLLYISFFPQLIAGPIIKYHDISGQLDRRELSVERTCQGIRRFIVGLSKKVLIANTMGAAADYVFSLEYGELGMLLAWIGAIAYLFQIYFDFSGYSDMAMGLGHMFHIQLPMNFNSPYKSCSVKELWQRWHMTLSRFFITYVYIPLGGSKKGKARTIFNTMAIFALSGLWHGANWTYVAWGVMQGLLVVWDNLGIIGIRGTTEKNPARFYIPRWLGWFFTFSFFNLSLFFFRSESMAYAFQMFKNLFSFRNTGYIYKLAANMDVPEFYIFKQAITMLAPDILNVAYIVLLLLMLAASAFILTRKNALQMVESTDYDSRFCWFITIIFIWSLISFSQVSTFIYFNF